MGAPIMNNAALKVLVIFSHAATLTFLCMQLVWFSNLNNQSIQAQNQPSAPSPLSPATLRLF